MAHISHNLGGAGERNRTVVTRLETWGNSHYTTPAKEGMPDNLRISRLL